MNSVPGLPYAVDGPDPDAQQWAARTPPAPPPPEELVLPGGIIVRPAEYQVLVDGRRAGLTRREFQIFHCLARRMDRVVTRHEIYEEVWGSTMTHRDRSVDVFVRKVRQKLAAVAPETVFIHTHFGIGYRLAPEPATPETSSL